MALNLQDEYSLFSLAEEERVVILKKFDCWIEQVRSFVTPGEGPPQGTSVPDRTTMRQDVTL